MGKQTLDKKTYKQIKRMSRKRIEKLLMNTYKTGFDDGAEAGDNADFTIKLIKILNNTKGVGIVLYDRIMQNAKEMER